MRVPSEHAQDNEGLIRAAFDRLNAGDLEAGKELMAADVELDTRVTSVSGRVYRGHAGLDQWAAELDESFEDMQQTPERLIPLDSQRTIVVTRIQARGRGSGVDIDETIASIFTVKTGKVTRVESYRTLGEAAKAGGRS